MRVSSWKFMGKSEVDTDCDFGLMLGPANRDKHFKNFGEVRVSIEGVVHSFSLARRNFWTTCPELRDTDVEGNGTPIRDFLERLGSLTWKKGKPAHFELMCTGDGTFELQVPALKSAAKAK